MPDGPQLGGIAGLLQSPYAQMAIEWLMDSLTSGRGSLLKYSNFTRGRSLEYNFNRAATNTLQAQMFGYRMQEQSEWMAQQLVAGAYKALGYGEESAQYQAAKTGMAPVVWGIDNFLGDQWNNGLETMYSAAFGRRAYESSNNNYARMTTDYRQLGDTLLKMHYQQGRFGSASFDEVGAIAANLIGSGRYDTIGGAGGRIATYNEKGEMVGRDGRVLSEKNKADLEEIEQVRNGDKEGTGFWTKDASGKDVVTTRADVIAGDVRAYSKALTKLQDVIGGDMTEVLDTLDKLFGSNATALSPERLNNVTDSLRQSMTATGMSLQQVATMAGTAFSYIAPYGGSETQGLQMANTASYYLGAGINVEGVKSDVYGSALLQYQGNRITNGDARWMAVAYQAYADKNNLNVHDKATYSKFIDALGNTPMTAGNLHKWAQETTGFGEAYFNAVSNNDETTKLIGEFGFTMDMMQQDTEKVQKKREASFGTLLTDVNKKLGVGKKIKSISDLVGGNIMELNDTQVFENVYKNATAAGMSREQARVFAGDAARMMRSTAKSVFYNMSDGEAVQTVINSRKAQQARTQLLYQEQLKDLYGDAADKLGESGRQGGFGGVVQELMKDRAPGEAANFAEILMATVGITNGFDKNELMDVNNISNIIDKNSSQIEARYKRVYGDKAAKGKTKDQMARQLIQDSMKISTTASEISTSKMRSDAKLDMKSYAELKARALEANLILSGTKGELSADERKNLYGTIHEWTKVTDLSNSPNAERIQIAYDLKMLEDLNSEEGKARIDAEIEKQHAINDFIKQSNKTATDDQRKVIAKNVRSLQTALDGMTEDQRSQFAETITGVDKSGKITYDEKKLTELKKGLGDNADSIVKGAQDASAVLLKSQMEGRNNTWTDQSAKFFSDITKDAITLTNSNDPIQNLLGYFKSFAQELFGRLPDKGK